ncbi:MAG: hypothetical protein ACPL1K_02190 [Candidatus Kryptoniota bacterium]
MYKLVILIESSVMPEAIDANWAEFLHQAEAMPKLRRESSSRIDSHLFGSPSFQFMHELIFDTAEDAHSAMASEAGRNAGRLLQAMTGGRLVLFLADHKEDDIENIRKYRQQSDPSQTSI